MAVVAVVEERHAAAQGFRQQFVAVSAVVVNEGDAGFPGDVGEFSHGNFIRRRERAHTGGQKQQRQNGMERGCVPPKRDQPQQLRKTSLLKSV